jgi:hypothetical protein
MNYSERTHILKTVDRLREIVGEDDYPISLYEKLFFETNETLSGENAPPTGHARTVP